MTWLSLFITYYFGFQACRLFIYVYRNYGRDSQIPCETGLSDSEAGGEVAWLLCSESGEEEQEEKSQASEIPLNQRVGKEKSESKEK